MLCLQLKHNVSKSPKLKSIIDLQSIECEIANTDLSHILQIEDANLATDTFVSTLSTIIGKHTKTPAAVPRKRIILKPWITQGLLRCIRNRDRLHKKLRNNPNNLILKISYKRYRNFCNRLLRRLKITYEKNELLKSKNNLKATWKTIKRITNSEKLRNSPDELLKLAVIFELH